MNELIIMALLALNNTVAAPGPQTQPIVAPVSLSQKVYRFCDMKLPVCKPVEIEFTNDADRSA
jgi:hypothetical protein